VDYVIIDPECFFGMVFSSIEVYNRETTGFILGKKRRRMIQGSMENVVTCEMAYPMQTASRKPTSVTKGNIRAFERIRASVPSLGLNLIGEYHSHPYMGAELTKDDLEYISETMEQIYEYDGNLISDHWLEVVVAIRKRTYSSRRKVGWKWSDYKNKARCVVTINPYLGYDLTFGGYWVCLDDDKIKHTETTIYIPWEKGYWS